jgi:hypothetical protein
LQDLDEAVRRYLAWDSILAEETTLNLDPHQKKQAEGQKSSADTTVNARLPEAYQWLLVPTQKTPQAAVEWQAIRLTGQDPLAVRASKKLRNDELLIASYAPSCLRLARGPRHRQAARRGLRAVSLPTATQEPRGASQRGHGRPGVDLVAAGLVRIRRQLR